MTLREQLPKDVPQDNLPASTGETTVQTSKEGQSPAMPSAPAQILGIYKQFLTSGVDLDIVNRVSTLILIALISCIVVVMTTQRPRISKLMETVSKIKVEVSQLGIIEAFQPVDYYLGQVRQRDIFNVIKDVNEQTAEQPQSSLQLRDRIVGLRMVGISRGTVPKVMIEDNTIKAIYFLKKGDRIGKTEVQIKDILHDKVIISYNQEEMEWQGMNQ